MYLNYLHVAFRNLIKNRFHTLISICGLGLGLACVFLILQYLRQELKYDRFHDRSENIYRITWQDENPQTRTPHPMAQAMVKEFPEVMNAVSLSPLWGFGLTKRSFSFYNPERDIRFDESNILAVDSTFFKVFTFPLIKGDPEKVLTDPNGILLSESMAKKYFDKEDPIGKQLAVNDEEDLIEVVGVFKDVPLASHFHFDFLISYVREKASEDLESGFYSWNDFGHYNYVMLQPGTDAKALEDRLDNWAKTYINIPDDLLYQHLKDKNYGFRLQPLTDIHLNSHLRWELEANGYMSYIYMMIAAALLIMVIASVNFINLTTAQSANRSKEIGIRKSLGARRGEVATQFTGESLLVSMIAVALALVIVESATPFFTQITGGILKIDYMFFGLTVFGMGLLIGLIGGIFPSVYLASAKPSIILRGKFLQNPSGSRFRQGFTVLQFFASMILITTSIVIYNQLEFIQNSALGFDEDQVVVIPIKNSELINQRFNELRNELLQVPHVTSVSAASNIPGKHFNQNPIFTSTNPQLRIASSEIFVDHDFFSVLNIETVDGRLFSKDNVADRDAFILNETAAKNLYQGNAVGKELSWDFGEGLIEGTVIGVVKDFHFQSLHEAVRPLFFRLSPHYNYVVIKLNTNNFSHTAISIENTWKKFDNRFAFDFAFLSSYIDQQYRQEQSMAAVLGAFSCIAIIIACFGLLAIAALTFRQKTKEVSIRKIMGATVVQIMLLLAKDFTRLVLAAIILAVPVSWWIIHSWLDNFTFRTTIDPLIFVGAGFLLLGIAWFTLSYLVWRVSRINPVETLKND